MIRSAEGASTGATREPKGATSRRTSSNERTNGGSGGADAGDEFVDRKEGAFEDSREEREKDRVDSPGRPLIELCSSLDGSAIRENRPNFWQKFAKKWKICSGFFYEYNSSRVPIQ